MDEDFSTSLEELSDVDPVEEIQVKPKKKVRFAEDFEEIKPEESKSIYKSFQNTVVVFILMCILAQVDITNFLISIIKRTYIGSIGSSIVLSLIFSSIFFVINYFII